MSAVWRDLRHAARVLLRAPAFTIVAVLTLAVSIGGVAAMFGVVDALLLRPISNGTDDDALVGVYSRDRTRPDSYRAFSYSAYLELKRRHNLFASLTAQTFVPVGLRDGELTRRTYAAVVPANYFSTLSSTLAAGRSFTPEEERPGSDVLVAIVSTASARRLAPEPAGAVGREISVNSRPYKIVGVTPEGFTGTTAVLSPEVWLPTGAYDAIATPFGISTNAGRLAEVTTHVLLLAGRLASDAKAAGVDAMLGQVEESLAREQPAEYRSRDLLVHPLSRLSLGPRPQDNSQYTTVAVLLIGISVCLLIVACLNLANLMLARSALREAEMSVRLALGSSRGRIVRQLLSEGLLLSAVGTAAGLVLAWWTTGALAARAIPLLPIGIVYDPRPDGRMLTAAVVLSVVSTVAFNLGPALTLSRSNAARVLNTHWIEGAVRARRRITTPQLLVIGQVAVSMALLTIAGLFVRAAAGAATTSPGYSLDGRMLVDVDPSVGGITEARSKVLYGELMRRLRSAAGVRAASLASVVPFGNVSEDRIVTRSALGEGEAQQSARAVFAVIGSDYFRSLGLPMIAGREFVPGEEGAASGRPVAIIDRKLARQLFADESPVGRSVTIPMREGGVSPPLEVVGLAPPLRHNVASAEPEAHLYVPFGQHYRPNMTIQVQSATPDADTAVMLRQQIRGVDAGLPVLALRTMRADRQNSTAVRLSAAAAMLFGTFGAIALGLATLGTYGLRAYLVAQRTREIGIRMALGATNRQVLRQFLLEGVTLSAVGMAGGLALAVLGTSASRSVLYQARAFDATIFGAAALTLIAASLLACYLPARRAARLPPAIALGRD